MLCWQNENEKILLNLTCIDTQVFPDEISSSFEFHQ